MMMLISFILQFTFCDMWWVFPVYITYGHSVLPLILFPLQVLSKGQIVDHKTVSSVENTIHVDLQVTFDMIPHARLLAYYIDEYNQVVADSVWFDVMHNCDNDVSIYVSHSEKCSIYATL